MVTGQFMGISGEVSDTVHLTGSTRRERVRRRTRPARFAHALAAAALLSVLFVSLAPVACQDESHVSSFAVVQDEPVANAGGNLTVLVGEKFVLNGSGSIGDGLNYTWSVLYESRTTKYYGMVVELSFPRPGGSEANLTVRDSLNRTSWDQINIVISEPPKTFLDKYLTTILFAGLLGGVALYVVVVVVLRVRSGQPVVSASRREKTQLAAHRYLVITKKVLRNPMGLIGVIVLVFFGLLAIFGPWITPYDVKVQDPTQSMLLPSKKYWLGTDGFGIDIFSELLYGARTSMLVGTVSAIIASVLGAIVGLYSGYVGGWKDEVVMRLNDVVLSIPWLVLMIIVAAFVGKIDLTGIILIIGLTGWSYTARMVRAQVLSVKERQYIERARAIGSSEMSIIRRHIFPNTFPLIFANTILTVAVSILSESTLSFLGMRPSNEVTWGTMLSFASEASAFETGRQWWIISPGLCIVTVVLGFTLLGYALDEILNPKLRRR
jgi:peptide/nickel transport system permease protein